MHIAHRHIAASEPPYIIAELGVNHDGSLERAVSMTHAAARAGANAIKLQLFDAGMLMSRACRLAGYQASAGETDPIAMLQRLQLTPEQLGRVADCAHSLKMHAIVTVFSVELVPRAQWLPFDAYKTASPDITHKPLLKALEETGRPIILSTGASTLQEVGRALSWLRDARERTAVLQCVSSYPTPVEHAEFGGIGAIQEIFDGPVGYSDHTESVEAGAAAVLAGACVLEKHMTWSRSAPGPDHRASLTPEMFHEYRNLAHAAMQRCWPRASADADRIIAPFENLTAAQARVLDDWSERLSKMDRAKRVLDIEHDVRTVSRQSVVARRDLPEGAVLRREDLAVKRPGTGVPAWEFDRLIGARLRQPVRVDEPIPAHAVSL
ncbi:MAG TPA: N-acetylneuraminate synthase family protein [Phycisphaerales bacterium]|nr:N-acetylneuraminate synthase family protein [Phycisphaerales bacterium]